MFLEAAAFYAGLGWKVIPLAHMAKLPAIPSSKGGRGFKDATDDPAIIVPWSKQYPGANIGIATGVMSGITVVDIDPRNGGADTIARLAGKGLVFPPSPEARTGNNGRHLIFAYDPAVRASKDKLGAGIDLKADGGYIVAAPSRIAKSDSGPGGEYRWVRAPHPKVPLPRLPKWALDLLLPKQAVAVRFDRVVTTDTARKSLEGMAARIASARSGSRNNVLNWAAFNAGKLVRDGKIGQMEASSRLTQAALASGLALPEVAATISSGMKAAIGGAQ